ncbi:MAG TPA: response regulator transcription factor [Planctomycetes bacterium]|nr:response regulator transcription factor [Planctomycetota bacterium]
MSQPRHLLVVEDDPDLAQLARMHLEEEGYRVSVERDGRRALELALGQRFDLLVLDLMLPGVDGLEICRALRKQPHYVPIIMVTAKGAEFDRILGLELGADDYLSKPVSLRELSARVRAMFRRIESLDSRETRDEVFVRGNLKIDPLRRSAWLDDQRVELTAKEFDLLHFFASHPGRVFTRSDLVDALWGPGYAGYEHTVNSHINRLRRKINGDGDLQKFIETVWGVGYRFNESP